MIDCRLGFTCTILLALWLHLRHTRRRTDGQVRGSKRVPILAAAALVIGTWASFVYSRLLTFLFVRTEGVQDFAAVAPAHALVHLICHLAAPALPAGLLVVLYLHDRREVQVQQ